MASTSTSLVQELRELARERIAHDAAEVDASGAGLTDAGTTDSSAGPITLFQQPAKPEFFVGYVAAGGGHLVTYAEPARRSAQAEAVQTGLSGVGMAQASSPLDVRVICEGGGDLDAVQAVVTTLAQSVTRA
jgi:hypothetical protein